MFGFDSPQEGIKALNLELAESGWQVTSVVISDALTELELAKHVTRPRPRPSRATAQSSLPGVDVDVTQLAGQRAMRYLFDGEGQAVSKRTPPGLGALVARAIAGARARAAAPPPEPEPEKPPPLTGRELQLAQLANALGEVVRGTETVVRHGDGEPFGAYLLTWDDVVATDGATWVDWLAPHVETTFPDWSAEGFRRAVVAPEWPPVGRDRVLELFRRAFASEYVPAVLDLRGYPTVHGVVGGGLVEVLATELRRLQRGMVIIVEKHSWVLERCLP